MTLLAGFVVVAAGLWLVGLGAAIFLVPSRAERFLRAFASSARAHYTEQALRLTVGAAIIVFSPQMPLQTLLRPFGWLLALTAVGLLLVPWTWHQRFAEWAIPLAIRHMKLYAIGATALGLLLLWAALRSPYGIALMARGG